MKESVTFNRILMKSGGKIIALCPELNISIETESIDSAKKELAASVGDFLKDARKDKQLEMLLEDAAFKKKGDSWISPEIVETGSDNVNL